MRLSLRLGFGTGRGSSLLRPEDGDFLTFGGDGLTFGVDDLTF